MTHPTTFQAPRFGKRSVLCRYIDREYRKRNNRPNPNAYRLTPNEKYLSVNSLEIHTRNQVAAIYAEKFENGNRPVALAEPTVSIYNAAASEVGVTVAYNSDAGYWHFSENGNATPAYLHHGREHNESHCGVEFVRALDDFKEFQFSVRMAKSKTYKSV